MIQLNLITFASVFQKKTEESIRTAHSELFEALDKHYNVRIVFEEELPDFLKTNTQGQLTMVFVATGGTEGMAVSHYNELPKPLYLLTDGKANSLAASLELSCWVRHQNEDCIVVHGTTTQILAQLSDLEKNANQRMMRIGVFGEPSDWLVASHVDYRAAMHRWGVQFVDISLDRVIKLYATIEETEELYDDVNKFLNNADGRIEPEVKDLVKAYKLFYALRQIVAEEQLNAMTLQCFNLIPALGTTGCLALALLNDEGIVAGCEGDLPSVFTMLLAKRVTGHDAFMANPSFIDSESNEVLFAHCTIGLKQTDRYIIRSHFESQSGVAIQGILPKGPVTVMKVGGVDLGEMFAIDGEIVDNENDEMKCRTQIRVRLGKKDVAQNYFLGNSIGNHHIIVQGHYADMFKNLVK